MDFWKQQALLESISEIRSAYSYTLRSIYDIQSCIAYDIKYADTHIRIRYTKPDYKEIYDHLLHNRFSTLLISIDEIPEKLSSDSEQRLYNRIQNDIYRFNKSNKYLFVQGNAGDYTIKANNDFYTVFNSNVVRRESVDDFF